MLDTNPTLLPAFPDPSFPSSGHIEPGSDDQAIEEGMRGDAQENRVEAHPDRIEAGRHDDQHHQPLRSYGPELCRYMAENEQAGSDDAGENCTTGLAEKMEHPSAMQQLLDQRCNHRACNHQSDLL